MGLPVNVRRVNISLPHGLTESAHAAGLNVSGICRIALQAALDGETLEARCLRLEMEAEALRARLDRIARIAREP